jgi:hypothetical protein
MKIRELFGHPIAASTDPHDQLWRLVESLQEEKRLLSMERDFWRDKFTTLMGIGDMSYPRLTQAVPESDGEIGPALQPFTSISGLRARSEIRRRNEAKELSMAKEKSK